jgi:hypothetical protein
VKKTRRILAVAMSAVMTASLFAPASVYAREANGDGGVVAATLEESEEAALVADSEQDDESVGAGTAEVSLDKTEEVSLASTNGATLSGVDEASLASTTTSTGLGVATHSKEDIISFVSASGALLTDEVEYKTDYSISQPYETGELTEDTLNKALAMLNNIRYIAGLNYNVALDDTYTEWCQAGSLVNAINGELTHYPTQPDGVSDELMALAEKGCGQSNIAWGYQNLNMSIVSAWMNDGDDNNISRVGHRSWCLNPTMGKTGFGAVGAYTSMYSWDTSNSSTIKRIAWPAQEMPVEYFGTDYPWSVFTGTGENINSVVVTLTRASDGKVWTFSKDSADGYFNVANYIQNGTIVFRPSDIESYQDGDSFTVSVTGTTTPISYTVNFFSLGEDLAHSHDFTLSSVTPDFSNMSAAVKMKCTGCDNVWDVNAALTITNDITCGEKGSIEYSFKMYFQNSNWSGSGYAYTSSLPHYTGSSEFVWDGGTCKVQSVCNRCGETVSEACEVSSTTTATCGTAGVTTYTATYNGAVSTNQVETAATGDHNYGEPIFSLDTNGLEPEGSATFVCTVCKQMVTKDCQVAIETTEPTCTDEGTIKYTSTVTMGDASYSDTVTESSPALGHVYTEYISNNDAECGVDGTKTATCDNGCGTTETVTDIGSALEHVYTTYVSNDDATCESDGTKTAKCDNGCGERDTIVDEGSQTSHEFGDYVSDDNATCEEDGTKTATCIYGCGKKDTVADEGSALGHIYTKYKSNGDATCRADGTETAVCDNGCGASDTRTEEGSKLGHSFTEYVSNGDATCEKDGTKTAKCDNGCGESDTVTDVGSKLEHIYTNYTAGDEATCTRNATEIAECDYGCGTTDVREVEGTQLDHEFGEYVSDDNATCEADGTKTATCIYDCGTTDTVEEEGSALGHSFTDYEANGDATCETDETETAECDNGCGASDTRTIEDSKKDHEFGDYVSDDNATCEEDGTKTATCIYGCGTEITIADEGSALGHSYTKYKSNGDATCKADGTETAACDNGCGTSNNRKDEGSKLDHSFTEYVSKDDATCLKDGTKIAQCDYGCGATDTSTDKGSKLEHSFIQYVIGVKATCTENATEIAECDYGCGTTDEREIEKTATGHSFTKYVSDNNATCLKNETTTAECDNGCGKTETVEKPGTKLEHSYTKYKSNGDATCMADGTETAVCDNGCGTSDTRTEENSKLDDHKFGDYVSDGNATCESDGTKTATCVYGCGTKDTVKDEGSKLEHKYTHYTSRDKATCTKNATEIAECDNGCGTTDVREIEKTATGHSFTNYVSNEDATCEEDGTKTAQCDYGCGASDTVTDVGSGGHIAGSSWKLDTPATTTNDGTKIKTCTRCGDAVDMVAIPKIASATLSYTTTVYTGKIMTPRVIVKDSKGSVIGSSNYTVTYKNNKEAGVATVTLTFKNNYSGTLNKNFVIKPATTAITKFENTSKGLKLTWKKAASGTGYVIYRSINGGKYSKVKTISGLSTLSYTDTGAKKSGVKYSYKLYVYKSASSKVYLSGASAAKATYYVAAPAWKTLSNNAAKKITVKVAADKKATGYQIQYSTSSAMTGAKTVTLKGASKVKTVLSNLKKGKTYYVRVRTYKTVSGKNYYSTWNTKKKVKITK